MSEPSHGDPTAVILARMETKLDNALAVQATHATTLSDLMPRVVRLETRLSAAWAGIGLLMMALGVVAAFLAAR